MQHHLVNLVITQERNKTYHKVSFSLEKFRTEQTMVSICQPQRLETNKTFYFMWASFWREVHRSRWKAKFKTVDESHTNKTFQRAAKMSPTLLPTSPAGTQYSANIRCVFAQHCNIRDIQGTFIEHFKGKDFFKKTR